VLFSGRCDGDWEGILDFQTPTHYQQLGACTFPTTLATYLEAQAKGKGFTAI
jgi:hypothetical protein